MYKLDLPVDMKETAATQRRRNAELQRQSRIFNARVRTIGVNMDQIIRINFIGKLPVIYFVL
jgi:hypothetical protein